MKNGDILLPPRKKFSVWVMRYGDPCYGLQQNGVVSTLLSWEGENGLGSNTIDCHLSEFSWIILNRSFLHLLFISRHSKWSLFLKNSFHQFHWGVAQ